MKLGDLINFTKSIPHFPVFPILLRTLGVKEAVFLCRVIWWQRDGEDWIEQSTEEIGHETGLSYKEQLAARRTLVQRGIIEEKYRRLEHRLAFRVIADSLLKEVSDFAGGASAKREDGELPETGGASAKREDGECQKGKSSNTGKTKKDIKTSGAKAPAHPGRQEFIDLWCESYESHFGQKYHFADARDGKAVNDLLALGLEWPAILKVATRAWSKMRDRKTHFHCAQAVTFHGLVRNWNPIRLELDPPGAKPNYDLWNQPQPK